MLSGQGLIRSIKTAFAFGHCGVMKRPQPLFWAHGMAWYWKAPSSYLITYRFLQMTRTEITEKVKLSLTGTDNIKKVYQLPSFPQFICQTCGFGLVL